jgi:hypothetical protein
MSRLYERFHWLAKEIVDMGGEATLVRVNAIEGMPYAAMVAIFNEARARDYDELAGALADLIKSKKSRDKSSHAFTNQLHKLKERLQDIRDIDYFQCPRAEHLQMLFNEAVGFDSSKKKAEAQRGRLRVEDFRGKTWVTRPKPEIDCVGSAWLIRKFIDPEAKFVFASTPGKQPDAIPYDMFQVELSHHDDFCTFETLVNRFGIRDRAACRLAELIHDSDLADDKFHWVEGFGIERVIKGWAKQGLSDEEILLKGFECFDGLYAEFKMSRKPHPAQKISMAFQYGIPASVKP